jgi:hypothetical protein
MAPMRVAAMVILGLLIAGCYSSQSGPVLGPSGGQPAYALRYPDALTDSVKAIGDGQDQERKLSASFGAQVDELKKPDWDLVRSVVDESDVAGKTTDFADAHGEVDAVRTFWGDEKGTVDAKVAAGSQYAVKQSTCAADCTNLDVSGQAVHALNESMDKELQKRLRAHNDAFVLIERQRSTLGVQNTAVLEKLADEVAQASYIVHVDLVVHAGRVNRLLADTGDVKSTLDRFIADEQAYQARPGRAEADKKASDERIALANKSKAAIDSAVTQAQAAAKSSDDQIAAASKDYENALDALRAKIDQKKKSGA